MIAAAAVHAYNTSSAVGAVSSCLQACHKALRISKITVIEQEYDKALAKVATLEQKTALKKVAAISLPELNAVVHGAVVNGERREGWGGRDMPLVLRQMALQMELSFYKLLHFSCMAIVNLFFVYLMGKSFAFKLVKRKNDQSGNLPWLVVAWTAKDCLAQRFRDFVIDTNPGLVIPAWGFARSKNFLIQTDRPVGAQAHRTFALQEVPEIGRGLRHQWHWIAADLLREEGTRRRVQALGRAIAAGDEALLEVHAEVGKDLCVTVVSSRWRHSLVEEWRLEGSPHGNGMLEDARSRARIPGDGAGGTAQV
jgi:hypothetical protein